MIAPTADLSEDAIKQALIDARGDLFIAATTLSISPLRMQKYVQASSVLEVAMGECQKSRSEVSTQNLTSAVEAAIQQRVSLYRVVGLDALHDLAAMPIGENSAMAQVKLGAAVNLVGSTAGSTGGGELAETLRALNESYHSEAPRIRVTRERLMIETMPQERVVDPTS